MSAQSEKTKAAREAKLKYEYREHVGAAFYQLHAAVNGRPPKVPFYLHDEAAREEWRVKAEQAAGVLVMYGLL